ncbi:DUF1003 domain-containing protein [Mycetocola miduiensis]|uniref:Uncharacterized membrane protein n=1 Tax=Mycetocola miduiensis TaxID=995034 RepID=A0A1I5CWX4_9MICO|nr:DUF1003 domain-containing protein [Mycetocola miduiensis]SFN91121.1 Uncharacterized membrane protein [Mycetocola miduiensis]
MTLSRGDRAADRLRNGMGSWRFVGIFLLFMALWALFNSFDRGWDPYPYILLNLFLSMLAGLQGAVLLIAAKRQDAISAALARHDYETDRAAKDDIEQLVEISLELFRALNNLREHEGLEPIWPSHARLRSPSAVDQASGLGDRDVTDGDDGMSRAGTPSEN